MKKEHRIAFRSILELLALGGIKVDTALRRIYVITEIIEAGKSTKVKTRSVYMNPALWNSGLGRCTKRPLAV